MTRISSVASTPVSEGSVISLLALLDASEFFFGEKSGSGIFASVSPAQFCSGHVFLDSPTVGIKPAVFVFPREVGREFWA
jgi:hypothetical protein